MRWFVEISSLGKNSLPVATLCVEAAQWQPALQKARSLRGDDGALSNFSIELLDDGYRAIDPTTRLRYVVRRAPDDAVLTNGTGAPADARPAASTVSSAVSAASPDGGAAAVSAADAPAEALENSKRPARTLMFSSSGAAAVREAIATATASPKSDDRKDASARDASAKDVSAKDAHAKGEGGKPESVKAEGKKGGASKSTPPKGASAKGQAKPSSQPPRLSLRLVSKREEDPSVRSPLTYREYVYAVPEGTCEVETERLLRERLDELRADLSDLRPGKFVNLAAFGRVTEGKARGRPLVTLSWKDWKGETPEVRYPARGGPGNSMPPFATPSGPPPTPSAPPPLEAEAAEPSPAPAAAGKAAPADTAAGKAAPADTAAAQAAPAETTAAQPAAPAAPEASDEVDVPVDVEPAPEAAAEPARVEAEPPVSPAQAQAADAPPPALAAPSPEEAAAPVEPPAAAPAPDAGAERAAPAAPEAGGEREREPPKSGVAKAKDAESDEEERSSLSQETPPPSSRSSKHGKAQRAAAKVGKPSAKEAKPAASPPKRLSGDDLIAELFEAFSDLHFLRDALEGADFTLSVTLEKLPAEVGVVSLYDIDRREFVVVRQQGGPRSALLHRLPERSSIAQKAMRGRRAVVIPDVAADPRPADDRWSKTIGVELRSYACAPVELAGRYLGLIEIANPLDGHRFTESDGNALTYIGEQFAEFVAQRGVVVDPEVVLASVQRGRGR